MKTNEEMLCEYFKNADRRDRENYTARINLMLSAFRDHFEVQRVDVIDFLSQTYLRVMYTSGQPRYIAITGTSIRAINWCLACLLYDKDCDAVLSWERSAILTRELAEKEKEEKEKANEVHE